MISSTELEMPLCFVIHEVLKILKLGIITIMALLLLRIWFRMGEWGTDVLGTGERCNLIFKQYQQHYC